MRNLRRKRRVHLLVLLLALAGCQSRRPDFMMRVHQDCASGDKWACDLIDAMSKPIISDDVAAPVGGAPPGRER